MGYAVQQRQTTTPEPTAQGGGPEQQQRRPDDVVPEENRVASEDGGPGTKPGADAEAAEAEKARQAKVTAKWEGMLGKWLGGKLAPLVLEHVSLDALNGYVQEGLNAAGPALGKALKDEAKPDKAQEKALKDFSDALAGVMTGQVEKWVQSEAGQKVLKAISEWVEDNPGWVMTIVGSAVIGGALAVWFTNQDLPKLEVPLKLGGTTLKAGLDLGTIQQLGFQGASLVVANKNAKINAKAEVTKKEDKDGDEVTRTTHAGSVELTHGDEGKETLTFVMNGSVAESKDGLVAHTAGGSLKLVDPDNGVTLTVAADGKWDSTGAKQDSFKYTLQTAADAAVSGKLSFGTKNVTIVDKDGNIVTSNSHEIAVAVGDKANKFAASLKSEAKDGETTTTVGVEGQAQLGAGTLFKGDANVAIGEGQTTVKLNGQLKTTIGGREVTFDGAYQSDGPITGKIRIGEGDAYREISGTKSGDVVTFKTKDVFAGGSLERESSRGADGTVQNQTTATAALGNNTTLTASGGDRGARVGVEANRIGGTGLSANAHAGDDGYGAGVKYEEGWLKAHLDYTMKQGVGTLNAGATVNTPGGFTFDGKVALEDDRIKELALQLGYKDPEQFRTFLVGYKQKWVEENQAHAHSFDALLEYSWGNWSARLKGGVDLMGNQVQKANLDLMGGYKLNNDWAVIGGMQVNGAMDPGGGMKESYRPYVGLQYGNIGVAGYYDSQSKGGGVMLTIPLGFGKKRR